MTFSSESTTGWGGCKPNSCVMAAMLDKQEALLL